MHYFIDHTKISNEVKAYGPLAADPAKKYNVTTQFALSGTAKAFACQSGLILVVQAPAPDLVNVILKPAAGLDIAFGKIKYYIYRGLQKSSFFTGPDINPLDVGNTEFIRGLWLGHNLVKLVMPLAGPPSPAWLGFD